MFPRISKLVASFIILSAPVIGHAYSCVEIVNGIYADTKHYSSLISDQHLPWMNLSWLIKNLGKPQTKMLPNNNIKYVWRCENDSYLIAYSDNNKTLNKVSGRYSNDDGSDIFYSFLKQNTLAAPTAK